MRVDSRRIEKHVPIAWTPLCGSFFPSSAEFELDVVEPGGLSQTDEVALIEINRCVETACVLFGATHLDHNLRQQVLYFGDVGEAVARFSLSSDRSG